MNIPEWPLLNPAEHAEIEKLAGCKLTNEQAQVLRLEFLDAQSLLNWWNRGDEKPAQREKGMPAHA